MKKYYFHDGKDQKGPYTAEELQQFNIKADTPIWHEGLDEWTEAKNVFDLKSVPPPLKKKQTPPLINKAETEKEQSKSNGVLKFIVAMVVFVILFYGAISILNESQRDNTYEIKSAIREHESDKQKDYYRKNLQTSIIASPNNYQKDLLLGGIWDLIIKLSNKTPYTLEEVEVHVYYIKADKTLYKTERLFFKNLTANQEILLSAPTSDKGIEIGCKVVNVNSRELGL